MTPSTTGRDVGKQTRTLSSISIRGTNLDVKDRKQKLHFHSTVTLRLLLLNSA
jgi:hypothetical protein